MPTQRSPDSQTSIDMTEELAQLHYWLDSTSLGEIPGPLKRSVETRAVERFFLDWTLHPTNDGSAPGYMQDLPSLYSSATSGSVLWHAVRAVAFADLKGYTSEPFAFQARQNYGGALQRMRRIAEDSNKWEEDRILAALLLIDHFETMYLFRLEPLGSHKQALVYALSARGENQFHSRPRFELWRTANLRLQAEQVLRREAPSDTQLAWIGMLNTSLPDIHICVDVMKMVIVSAAARKLGERREVVEVAEAMQLAETMEELIDPMVKWSGDVAAAWRRLDDGARWDAEKKPSHFLPHLPHLRYNDPWLAYKWNFHVASQIVLRESLIETLELAGATQYDMKIRMQAQKIAESTGEIIASLPPLLGLGRNE